MSRALVTRPSASSARLFSPSTMSSTTLPTIASASEASTHAPTFRIRPIFRRQGQRRRRPRAVRGTCIFFSSSSSAAVWSSSARLWLSSFTRAAPRQGGATARSTSCRAGSDWQ
eukprot:Amastigsp_a340810_67.p6 type:complete len:114 gc:universal Amastigsp_a340810_67:1257-1598(+)